MTRRETSVRQWLLHRRCDRCRCTRGRRRASHVRVIALPVPDLVHEVFNHRLLHEGLPRLEAFHGDQAELEPLQTEEGLSIELKVLSVRATRQND